MYRKPKRLLSDAARRSDGGTPVPPSGDERILIDKLGHKHSQRVLTMWSPAVLKAMGIGPIMDSGEGSK